MPFKGSKLPPGGPIIFMPHILGAVKSYATLGEIADVS